MTLSELVGKEQGKTPDVNKLVFTCVDNFPAKLSNYRNSIETPILRKENTLYFGLSPEDTSVVLNYIRDNYRLPVIQFADLINGNPRDILKEYAGKKVIVEGVFNSDRSTRAEKTREVFGQMLADSEMHRTAFYIFADPNNQNVLRLKYNNNPVDNLIIHWVDLSGK